MGNTNTTSIKSVKRALKLASKDKTREILMSVHLDANGDVVATDGFRMYVEHGGCKGDSVNVPAELVKQVAKLKKVDAVEFEDTGDEVVARYDGGELRERALYGKYPNYLQLMECKHVAVAYAQPKQIIPLLKEYKRAKCDAFLSVHDRDLRVIGSGEDMPIGRFEKVCDGADVEIAFNPDYLQSALETFGSCGCELRIESAFKPLFAVGGNVEVLVMPVRSGGKVPKKAAERAEKMAKKTTKPTKATDDELRRAIEHTAKDRAANDPDGRVQGGNASSYERNLLFEYERAGQLTSAVHGNFTSWYREGKFLVCVERRYSKRKIHLTYPELTPKFHKDDLVARKSDSFAKAFAKKCKDETGIELDVKPIEGGGIAASVKKQEKATEKKEDSMDKRIAELEKKLKAAEAKAKMWEAKAEEYYAANAKSAEPEPEPEAAESVATVVSLATMQEWCKAHEGTSTAQYGAATDTIWVYGVKRNEKQLKDELKAMGFAWAGKARHGAGWWAKPTA